jgi:hypothetical protein
MIGETPAISVLSLLSWMRRASQQDGEKKHAERGQEPDHSQDTHDHDPVTVGNGGRTSALVEEKGPVVLAQAKDHALPRLGEQVVFVAKPKRSDSSRSLATAPAAVRIRSTGTTSAARSAG